MLAPNQGISPSPNSLPEILQHQIGNLVLIRMFEIWNHLTLSELQRNLLLTENGQNWIADQLNLLHTEHTLETKAGQGF